MKKYWVCIVEVDTKNKLPEGFDLTPRRAVIEAIESKNIKVKDCWSGWGCTVNVINKIKRVWNNS